MPAIGSVRFVKKGNGDLQALPISGGNSAGDTINGSAGAVTQYALWPSGSASITTLEGLTRYVSFWCTVDTRVEQDTYDATPEFTTYFVLPQNTIYQTTAGKNHEWLNVLSNTTSAGKLYIAYHEYAEDV